MVPIFSSQILSRYEKLTYKGLEIPKSKDEKDKEVGPIKKGLTGIASSYDRDH